MAIRVIDQHSAILSLEDKKAACGSPNDPVATDQALNICQGTCAAEYRKRKAYGITNLINQVQIVTLHFTITIDGVDQNFTCAQGFSAFGKLNRVEPRFSCAVVG